MEYRKRNIAPKPDTIKIFDEAIQNDKFLRDIDFFVPLKMKLQQFARNNNL